MSQPEIVLRSSSVRIGESSSMNTIKLRTLLRHTAFAEELIPTAPKRVRSVTILCGTR
jgi:hypothetical protein